MNEEKTAKLILPLRTTMFFPGCIGTVQINRGRSLRLLEHIRAKQIDIVLAPLQNIETDEPIENNLCPVGVLARVVAVQQANDSTYSVTFEAIARVRVLKTTATDPFITADVVQLEDEDIPDSLEPKIKLALETALRLVRNSPHYSPGLPQMFKANHRNAVKLVDTISYNIHFSFAAQRKLLDCVRFEERLDLLNEMLSAEWRRHELDNDEPKARAEDSTDQTDRDTMLPGKLLESRQGPGRNYENDNMAVSYRSRAEMAENLTIEVKEEIFIETERLRALSMASGEYGAVKRYLDWLLAVPWNRESGGEKNMAKIERIINKRFYGSQAIRDKILEYLAIKLQSETAASPALALCGPPGTGKAALAAAIAESLGRAFVRFSVAGMISDAEVRGEPRTLPEAMPGKIVTTLIEADCINPVVLIEDIDRLCVDDSRLAPALAFHEVIDTRQNRNFIDYYMSLPIDLSKIIFVFSVRSLDLVPEVLLDRMEIIEFSGYIDREKIRIAEKYLIPDLLSASGIKPAQLTFSTGAIKMLIENYTMEAGLGQMKTRLETICRKFSRARATSKRAVKWAVTEDNIEEYYGTPVYLPERAASEPEIGVAAGVAWTGSGGDIMMIEGLKMRGSGQVTCTGSLGEVMRESVQAAHSYVRSKADLLDIPHDDFNLYDIHVHFPQGAIPKDGPSAGATISLVIASVMSDRPIRNDIAMTGEVSLRGKVLPVSGIKEKIAAAHRAGIYKFVMPTHNEKDLKEISTELRDEMEFIFIDRTDQLFKIALLDYEPGVETLEDLLLLEARRGRPGKKSARSGRNKSQKHRKN